MTIVSVCSSASNSGISSAYVEPMMASPPIDTAVDTPRSAAVKVDEISLVLPPRRHAANDLGAVVEALTRQVHRLPPRDPLDDEGEVLCQQDAHAGAPWIFATARPAASHMLTDRSQYSIP